MATFELFRNKSLSQNEQFHKNNSGESIHKICLINGAVTSIFLIATFLVLCIMTKKLQIHQLSAINMFLLAIGAYFAVRKISPSGKHGSIDYFEGFITGMYASLSAVIFHALFLLIFTYFFPAILQGNGDIFGKVSNPFSVAAITLFEGIAGAFVITFSLMQYFKKEVA